MINLKFLGLETEKVEKVVKFLEEAAESQHGQLSPKNLQDVDCPELV